MNMKLVETGLAVIAFIVFMAAYEGLTLTIGGNDWWLKGFCAVIAAGVGTGNYLMWHGAFATAPALPHIIDRTRGWVTTLAGCVFVLAFSAWFSVTAIGGHEALRYGYEKIVGVAEKALAKAAAGGADTTSLRSRLDGLANEIAGLAECELERGCVTGSAGPGGVKSVLDMLASSVSAQALSLGQTDQALSAKHAEGKECLAAMRKAVSPATPADNRRQQLASGVDCLNAAIGDLRGTDSIGGVRQAMATIGQGVVIPLTVKTEKQKAAVANVLESIAAKGAAIADSLGEVQPNEAFTPVAMPPDNALMAVMVNWQAIVPAWSAAIALDLLPLILLSFQSTIMASQRRSPMEAALSLPVRDLLTAQRIFEELRTAPPTITLTRRASRRGKAASHPEFAFEPMDGDDTQGDRS